MDLDRFVAAQDGVFDRAIAELRAGAKRGHWMWFVFPQIAGLGHRATAQHYAIRSHDHARAYLAHPRLGARLRGRWRCSMVGEVNAPPWHRRWSRSRCRRG